MHDEFEDVGTVHAEPLNSVHDKEVAGYLDGMIKLIEEKVIMVDTGEEITLKSGTPAVSMYSDRTHLYTIPSGKCWLDWGKNRHRYIRRLGCSRRWTGLLLTSSCGQDCFEERVEQTLYGAPSDKTVKDLTWLLFDDSSDLWLQLGRVNATCGRNHRTNLLGLLIDDDDEELGDDDDLKFKMRGRRWKRLQGGSHAEFIEFSGLLRLCTSFTRCSAQGVAAQLAL